MVYVWDIENMCVHKHIVCVCVCFDIDKQQYEE